MDKYFYIIYNVLNERHEIQEEEGIKVTILYYGKFYSFGGSIIKHGSKKYPKEMYWEINIHELTTGYRWYLDTFDYNEKPKISSEIIEGLCMPQFEKISLDMLNKKLNKLRPEYLKALREYKKSEMYLTKGN